MSSAKVPISHMAVRVTQRSQIILYQQDQKESLTFWHIFCTDFFFFLRKAVEFNRMNFNMVFKYFGFDYDSIYR